MAWILTLTFTDLDNFLIYIIFNFSSCWIRIIIMMNFPKISWLHCEIIYFGHLINCLTSRIYNYILANDCYYWLIWHNDNDLGQWAELLTLLIYWHQAQTYQKTSLSKTWDWKKKNTLPSTLQSKASPASSPGVLELDFWRSSWALSMLL